MKSAGGHAAFMALAQRADVIVEGFRPGVVAALGVDYDAVRAVNPKVVYCALSGYGQTGPRAAFAGHDINYLGYAGALDYTGERGGAPALANLQIADLLGGAASAAIGDPRGAVRRAAHRPRPLTSTSRWPTPSSRTRSSLLGALEDDGTVAPRGDDLLTGGVPCYGVYRDARRRAGSPSARSKRNSGARCAQRSSGRTSSPLQFATGAEGDARPRESWRRSSAPRRWRTGARASPRVDCCVTPVLTFDEALADPQFAARAKWSSRGPRFAAICAAVQAVAADAFAVTRDAPEHGEHTRDVLREAGYADAAIDALVASRGVACGERDVASGPLRDGFAAPRTRGGGQFGHARIFGIVVAAAGAHVRERHVRRVGAPEQLAAGRDRRHAEHAARDRRVGFAPQRILDLRLGDARVGVRRRRADARARPIRSAGPAAARRARRSGRSA